MIDWYVGDLPPMGAFFAGVVKKLKRNLASEKVDGSRLYRIGKTGAASLKSKNIQLKPIQPSR